MISGQDSASLNSSKIKMTFIGIHDKNRRRKNTILIINDPSICNEITEGAEFYPANTPETKIKGLSFQSGKKKPEFDCILLLNKGRSGTVG